MRTHYYCCFADAVVVDQFLFIGKDCNEMNNETFVSEQMHFNMRPKIVINDCMAASIVESRSSRECWMSLAYQCNQPFARQQEQHNIFDFFFFFSVSWVKCRGVGVLFLDVFVLLINLHGSLVSCGWCGDGRKVIYMAKHHAETIERIIYLYYYRTMYQLSTNRRQKTIVDLSHKLHEKRPKRKIKSENWIEVKWRTAIRYMIRN